MSIINICGSRPTSNNTGYIPFTNINNHHLKGSKDLSQDDDLEFSDIEACTILPFLRIKNHCLQQNSVPKEIHLYSTESALLKIQFKRLYTLINSLPAKVKEKQLITPKKDFVTAKSEKHDRNKRSRKKYSILTTILILIILTIGTSAFLGYYLIISRIQLFTVLTNY